MERQYGLRYTGLEPVIKAAFGVSLDMKSGAGGWSMGLNFTYYPTVDARNDQAFRIIDILRTFYRDFDISNKVTDAFHQKALRKIIRLVASGKTSPLAVDYCNRFLMHEAFSGHE